MATNNGPAIRNCTIYVTRGRPSEAQRINYFLCGYHMPVENGTLTPADETSVQVVSVRSRPVTEDEAANYGADECDGCRGDVVMGPPVVDLGDYCRSHPNDGGHELMRGERRCVYCGAEVR